MLAPEVPITEIVGDAPRYAGQTVRIAGNVSQLLDPRALVLESMGVLGKESVLVLTREPANPMGWMLQPGQQAAAVGLVRVADVAAIERELGRRLEPAVGGAIRTGSVVVLARAVGRIHGQNIDWTQPGPSVPQPNI